MPLLPEPAGLALIEDEAIVSGRLSIASKTDVGMRRSENQDSLLVQPVTTESGERPVVCP